MKKLVVLIALAVLSSSMLNAQALAKLTKIYPELETKLIEWRRYLHANPELSFAEMNTGKLIADSLKSFGLTVKYPVAKTGVIAILKGGKPGPVIGIRADIDALPVTERAPISFASKVTADYAGQKVGVMHACGHDAHTAILLATAYALKQVQSQLPGTVVFFFQPAEEGNPNGGPGGAETMLKENVMDDPKIDKMYALHMSAAQPVGTIGYAQGAAMASADMFKIVVKGKGSHGSMPWGGVDPIMVSAQIIQNLQTIVSRQSNLTKAPLVISVGSLHSGVRSNIIPETAEIVGSLRALDEQMRLDAHASMRKMAKAIAESAGATATVEINTSTLVTVNDVELCKKAAPALARAAGVDNVKIIPWITGSEDFSYFGQKAPAMLFMLGGLPKGKKPEEAAPHHTPDFYLDESGFIVGVKAFVELVFSN